MRVIPGMTVICPADDVEARQVVKAAYEMEGPVYMRFARLATEVFHNEDYQFEIGKAEVIRAGSDVSIIACGLMVGNAIDAAEELAKEGISVRVVDMFSIKPIDEELIVRCAKETGAIVSAEEHNIYGGLGSAVAEVLTKHGCGVTQGFVGVNDCHGECGPYKKLLAKYGLDANAIANKVRETLAKK